MRVWIRSVVIAVGIGVAGAAVAAEPRSLEGKELSAARELQSGLESVAASILGGSLEGNVTGVVVTEDRPDRVTVRVTYEGFAGGKLWGEVLGTSRKRPAWVKAAEPIVLSDGGGEVTLSFEATPGTNGEMRSAYLRINVGQASRQTAGYRRLFELSKVWGPPVPSGADFLVTITPQPVGRTAELGPQPTVVVPSAAVRVAPPPSQPAAPPPSGPAGATMRQTNTMAAPAPGGTRAIGTTTTARMATTPTGAATPSAPAPAPTNAAARQLPRSEAILAFHQFQFGMGGEPNPSALGPAALPIRPFGDVRAEDIGLDLARVLNVFPEVYQDQRASTGIFYYLPQSYALKWDETEGYELRTVYSAAIAEGAAGQVLMAARLEAGIGAREQQIASTIVEAYARAHGQTFSELRVLPIDSLSVSLSDDLGRYSVPPDRVTVHGLSDVMGQLDVSWVTDERTKAFIQEALVENVGVNGNVTFRPTGRALGPRLVPVRLQLADFATFGPFRWSRTGWKNPTPYPITLRYLHALRLTPGHPSIVNTWSLGETKVPPGGQVRWNASGVPFWVDGQAQKMWLDYAVDRTCVACGTQVMAGLTGGVSGDGSADITFHTLTPLADAAAHEITVDVRSRYFDPRARELQTRQVVLNADGKDFKLGPLFPDDRSGSSGEPLFEYRLGLTLKNGQPFHGKEQWLASNDLRVPIGRFQLEASLGAIPEQ